MELNSKCACSFPVQSSALLNKIICLLEFEITQNNIPRISDMLYCFIAATKHGFMVVDLPNVMTLLEILSERFTEVPDFGDILKEILTICKIPIFLTCTSDVLRYAIDLQEYFSVLGYVLLRVEDRTLQKIVLETIVALLQHPETCKNQISLERRKQSAASSRFPEILAQIIFLINDEMFPQILDLTFKLVGENSNLCKCMTTEDVLNSLLIRIEDNWRDRYPDCPPCDPPDIPPSFSNLTLITSIVNLMGIYLNTNREHLKDVPVITRLALWHVRYVFNYLTLKQRNTSSRNLLLTCIIWLIDLFPNMDFVSSGLAQDFISATSQEVATYANDIILTKALVPADDFVFIKLFMCFLPTYLKYTGGKEILERNRIIHRLLKIINYPSNNVTHPKEHGCLIKIISYKILNTLVPHLEDEFIENSGPPILLKNIKNKVHTEGGLILLSKCLDTLRQSLQYDPRKVVLNSILFNNGAEIIINLCREFLDFKVFNDTAQICIQEIFHILSMICKHNDETFNNSSIEIAIGYLSRMFQPTPNEPLYDNRIMVAVMDFTWEVIVKNEEMSEEFFKKGGVYLMLDVLQRFPFTVQIITLGALVDLCDYGEGKCIPYLITWKGKNGMTLIPLLMKIFRDENKELGVKVGPNGEIADGKYPLMGEEQYKSTFQTRRPESNPAMSDMFVSCRPKIYALLSLMHERHRAIFEIANDVYKTVNEKIPTKDQITLLLAENYLGLKLGEAWEELKVEFDMMRFEPLPTDAYILEALVERTHKWGAHLKEVQMDLLKAEFADNLLNEQKVYRKLNDARITQAVESLNEAKYLARSTERMFRISQMYKQVMQVEKSLEKIKHGSALHRTFMTGSCVTPVFKQNVKIIEEKPKKDEQVMDPLVSPKESKAAVDYQDAGSSIGGISQLRKS